MAEEGTAVAAGATAGGRRLRPSGGIKSLLNEPVRAETDSWNREEGERRERVESREREEGERAAKLNLKFLPCLRSLPPSFFPLEFFFSSLVCPSLLLQSVGSLIRFPNGVSAIERFRRRCRLRRAAAPNLQGSSAQLNSSLAELHRRKYKPRKELHTEVSFYLSACFHVPSPCRILSLTARYYAGK